STVLRTNSSCLVIRSAVPLLVVFVPLLAALACLLQSRACDFLGLVRTHAMGPVADQALLDGVRLEIEVVLRVRIVDILVERSEEHTSELQSRFDLVCRLLLEKKKY